MAVPRKGWWLRNEEKGARKTTNDLRTTFYGLPSRVFERIQRKNLIAPQQSLQQTFLLLLGLCNASLRSLGLGNDLFRNLVWNYFVMRKLHRVVTTTLRHGGQGGGVGKHF